MIVLLHISQTYSGSGNNMKVELFRNLVAHGDAREGKWRGNWRMEWVASTLTLPPNVVYPTLLKLMNTPRLPAVDWTDAPTGLNGLVLSGKDEIWFLRVCHHVPHGLYHICRLWDTRWGCSLRYRATSWKDTVSIPVGVIGIYRLHNPSGHTKAMDSTQPLKEMSTRNISWRVKAASF